jgi:hypothetical protein
MAVSGRFPILGTTRRCWLAKQTLRDHNQDRMVRGERSDVPNWAAWQVYRYAERFLQFARFHRLKSALLKL